MLNTAVANFTIIFSGSTPKCYWKGIQLDGIIRLRTHVDEDESRIKLVISGTQDAIYQEMTNAGITVKKVD